MFNTCGTVAGMSGPENPYEPPECRVCGEPITVESVTSKRAIPSEMLVRRCYNPECPVNAPRRRAVDVP